MAERLGDRYELTRELGKGGMGVVFLAHDELLSRDVAIKMLSLDMGEDAPMGQDEALIRFLTEARAAANLSHPNVVTLYDVVDGNPPYIVMEYVEGITLRDLVEREGPLELSDACHIAESMCRGLAAAHGRGMVHRDIKPENVMVVDSKKAKVLDFGLAQFEALAKARKEETLLGTPGYMAPEQVVGEDATDKSDVFAAACVFIFSITGQDPFTGADVREILVKSVQEDIDLSEVQMGAGLRPMITRALSKTPADRPSAEELADALELGAGESPDRYSSFYESTASDDDATPIWETASAPSAWESVEEQAAALAESLEFPDVEPVEATGSAPAEDAASPSTRATTVMAPPQSLAPPGAQATVEPGGAVASMQPQGPAAVVGTPGPPHSVGGGGIGQQPRADSPPGSAGYPSSAWATQPQSGGQVWQAAGGISPGVAPGRPQSPAPRAGGGVPTAVWIGAGALVIAVIILVVLFVT